MYRHTDKVMLALKKQYIRLFRKIMTAKMDELNVLNTIVSVYKEADKIAKKTYLDVAIYGYLFAIKEAAKAGYKVDIPDASKTPIDSDWVLDMLEERDIATLYMYNPEWTRKRQRLAEALAASPDKTIQVDKAMTYAIRQVAHYADKATASAALKAFKDAGVKKVRWVTEQDDRVCKTCRPLDGQIFDIGKAPDIPQHMHCRCRLVPVRVSNA